MLSQVAMAYALLFDNQIAARAILDAGLVPLITDATLCGNVRGRPVTVTALLHSVPCAVGIPDTGGETLHLLRGRPARRTRHGVCAAAGRRVTRNATRRFHHPDSATQQDPRGTRICTTL